MKLVIRLIAFLLLWLAFATSAPALTEDEAERIARWAGFPGIVTVDRDVEKPNGYFTVFLGMPEVIVNQPAWMPDSWATLVLLHEIGHYFQWRGGYIMDMDPVDKEWQADVWGLRAACAYGVTLRDYEALWLRMVELYGDPRSPTHGRRSARMRYALTHAGEACGARAEAPWQA